MMNPDEPEDINFEDDESWYEEAMNALDSPLNNHHLMYPEDEMMDLEEEGKSLVRLRNKILEAGFEFIELKIGDYVCDIVFYCGTIDYNVSEFALTYQKGDQYLVIFKWKSLTEPNTNPIQLAGLVKTQKHYGTYRFVSFLHIEDELTDEMEFIDGFKINRELNYKDKPSLEIYKSDNIKYNQEMVKFMMEIEPAAFEFYNDFIIFELNANMEVNQYEEIMNKLEKF